MELFYIKKKNKIGELIKIQEGHLKSPKCLVLQLFVYNGVISYS